MSEDNLTNWCRPTYGVGGRQEIILGHIRGGHEVLHWGNYGVVCPDSITTNGNFLYLIKCREIVDLTPPGAAFAVGFFIWLFATRCRQSAQAAN